VISNHRVGSRFGSGCKTLPDTTMPMSPESKCADPRKEGSLQSRAGCMCPGHISQRRERGRLRAGRWGPLVSLAGQRSIRTLESGGLLARSGGGLAGCCNPQILPEAFWGVVGKWRVRLLTLFTAPGRNIPPKIASIRHSLRLSPNHARHSRVDRILFNGSHLLIKALLFRISSP
jgi:hypothetical protein